MKAAYFGGRRMINRPVPYLIYCHCVGKQTHPAQLRRRAADGGGIRKGRMSRLSQLPLWFTVAIVALSTVVSLRYLAALDAGVGHTVAIRTYVFWALVCVPVAYLADLVLRTAMDYRVVRLAVARVMVRGQKSRR